MNTVIVIFIAVIAVVGIILILGLFTRKDYALEREIVIDRPKTDVFNYIRFLKNMDFYNKWVMTDPNQQKTFQGIDGSEGFIYGWKSEIRKVGEGEQEIKKIVEGEKLDVEIRFAKPFEGIAQSHMTTETVEDNKTKVRLVFKSSMNCPMNLMRLFMSPDKMLGSDMAITLQNLKNRLENK